MPSPRFNFLRNYASPLPSEFNVTAAPSMLSQDSSRIQQSRLLQSQMPSNNTDFTTTHTSQTFTAIDVSRLFTEADHDTLVHAGNRVYAQCLQQLNQAEILHAALLREIDVYKKIYNEVITAIPQLLTITSNPFGHPIPVSLGCASVSLPNNAASYPSRRILLGRDLVMLTPLDKSDCSGIQYFSRDEWNKREKGKAGKGGTQNENVGLQFVEDANGRPVSYVLAKEMRTTLTSLFHSLLANGQAAEVSTTLTHEARTYLHVSMAKNFPLLLFCEGGRWKIDLMISQAYSGFWTNHGRKAIKEELVNVDMDAIPVAVVKRERAADGVYNDGEGSRRKKARLTQPSVPRPCTAPIIQIPSAPVLRMHAQIATPTTSSLSSALHPLSPSTRPLTPILPPSTSEQPTSTEIAAPPPQAGVPPVGKLSGSDAAIIPAVGGHTAVSVTPISLIASNADASRNAFTVPLTADHANTEDNTPPSTDIHAAAPVLPVEPSVTAPSLVPCSPKPAGLDTRLTTPTDTPSTCTASYSDTSSSSTSKTTEVPHTGINKIIEVKNPFMSFNRPRVIQSSTSSDTSTKATAESTPIAQPTSSNAVASGSSKGAALNLAQKRSKLFAKHKYKANVISTQNIFLAHWLQDHPEGHYYECTKAYGALSSDEIKELKEECSKMRTAKTSTQVERAAE